MTHSSRATPALRALTERDPALAALSLWCAHCDHDGATETRGTEIRYGPGFATLPLHEQVGLAGHHVLHVALQHSARMADMAARFPETFDAVLWQTAADAIVNEALLQAGHALPRPALTLTELLATAFGTAPPPGQALAEWDADRLYLRLIGGQGGEAGRARALAASTGLGPDLHPSSGPDEAGDSADWRAHLARAMAAGAAAGVGIGAFGHSLADLPRPRVPWEHTLRRLLLRATLDMPSPSHRRPSGRWLASEALARAGGTPVPVFQPGVTRSRPAPRLVIGLDCSTSIDEARLALFMAEITGIARRMAAECHVMSFDTEVRHTLRLDTHRAMAQITALDLPQGGGTDFAPLVARAKRMAPSALIVLTDLDGPTGPDPRFPVIWAVPDADPSPTAPFGRVLSLAR
jgi:hypothetical protein